ncbi:YcaO-like family protein [Plantactinospora sp. CA-294935]|uniref:YcaO-like family protein n=1 Tax=Plantactinospora sp. CA-294935 TaxID=3240012 RepID=UPI003D8D0694
MAELVRRLGMVVSDGTRTGPVRPAAATAHARIAVGGQVVDGFGAAPTPAHARLVAALECAERWAQFGRCAASVTRDSYAGLGDVALYPPDLGLYAPAQYRQPGFGLAAFDARAPLEWLPVADLVTGARRLVPVEFVHPRAPLGRPALVAETSSGSAAHTEPGRARLAALCEVVERDAAMLLWHRRPAAPVVPLGELPEAAARAMAELARTGYVGRVARVDRDIAVPTFLAIALRGRAFRYGLGTHPDPDAAAEHAVVELGSALRPGARTGRYPHLPLDQVRRAEQHAALYDDGPLHDVLRAFLADTLVSGTGRSRPGPSPGHALDTVLGVLGGNGLSGYSCDLTPPELADCGISVVRVLVPGLIPLSFGYRRLRLGCARLVGDTAPGRFSTLLPHFMC